MHLHYGYQIFRLGAIQNHPMRPLCGFPVRVVSVEKFSEDQQKLKIGINLLQHTLSTEPPKQGLGPLSTSNKQMNEFYCPKQLGCGYKTENWNLTLHMKRIQFGPRKLSYWSVLDLYMQETDFHIMLHFRSFQCSSVHIFMPTGLK